MGFMQNEGIRSDKPTIEEIAGNLGKIVDMSGAVNVGVGLAAGG
jgi:hypothetical protein